MQYLNDGTAPMTLMQLEKFVLKLNATAIDFIKNGGRDTSKIDMAKEFLMKAETTLANLGEGIFSKNSS